MAVAAASFNTEILSISSGLMFSNWANFSSFMSLSICCPPVCQTLPSTTIRGSLEPLMVDTPRKRIEVPLPRLPELATMSKPAIRPCKASSTVVKAKPLNSVILMLCWAVEISSTGMFRPEPPARFLAVTTTS